MGGFPCPVGLNRSRVPRQGKVISSKPTSASNRKIAWSSSGFRSDSAQRNEWEDSPALSASTGPEYPGKAKLFPPNRLRRPIAKSPGAPPASDLIPRKEMNGRIPLPCRPQQVQSTQARQSYFLQTDFGVQSQNRLELLRLQI